MKLVFADTFYWVALINPRDNWHGKAIEMTRTLERVQIVTTDEELSGILHQPERKPVSIEQMNQPIEQCGGNLS